MAMTLTSSSFPQGGAIPKQYTCDGEGRSPELRWSGAPEWLKDMVLRRVWPDHLSYEELVDEMDAAMKFPGTTNAWTMPIKNRIDMLTTGIRTPIGVKVFGPDLKKIEARMVYPQTR